MDEGTDYFLGCENRNDLEPLLDFFIEQHPELNFMDYKAKEGEAVCL